MASRKLAENVEQQQYFEAVAVPTEPDEGTRDLGPLYPFLISGGANTERYYFTHINNTTEYKLNIKPEHFGDESSYAVVFPNRIKEILRKNAGATIFCVFDWDTIRANATNLKKHFQFVNQFKAEIEQGCVVLCPSMPSIEYWFLLHFENYTSLIRSCGRKLQQLLTPYMMPYFPDSNKSLLNTLKSEKYVKNTEWVARLCADGKLDAAVNRAEQNVVEAETNGDLNEHSYSFIYKIFRFHGESVVEDE